MKKLLLIATMTLVAVGASAEAGDVSVGAFFNYGSWLASTALVRNFNTRRSGTCGLRLTEERIQILKKRNQSLTSLGIKYVF